MRLSPLFYKEGEGRREGRRVGVGMDMATVLCTSEGVRWGVQYKRAA